MEPLESQPDALLEDKENKTFIPNLISTTTSTTPPIESSSPIKPSPFNSVPNYPSTLCETPTSTLTPFAPISSADVVNNTNGLPKPETRIINHSRRPSRAERYETLVEKAREMLSPTGTLLAKEESNEDRVEPNLETESIAGKDWRECVASLLMVVDGMGRQLSTHDELAAQLKIAQSNLSLAGAHSDFLEETLKRRDSISFNARQRGSIDIRTSRGSTDMSAGEESSSKTGGFFSRGSISGTRRKAQSHSVTPVGNSPIEGMTAEEWIPGETTKTVTELQVELHQLQSSFSTLQKSHQNLVDSNSAITASSKTLLDKNVELEKSKGLLLEELENLSVELFEEANKMVADERKNRLATEAECEKLKEEIEKLKVEIETNRRFSITEPRISTDSSYSQASSMDRAKLSTSSLPRLDIPSPLSAAPSPALSSFELNSRAALTPSETTLTPSETTPSGTGRKWYSFGRSGSVTASLSTSTIMKKTSSQTSSTGDQQISTTTASPLVSVRERSPDIETVAARMERFDSESSTIETETSARSSLISSSSEDSPFPDELDVVELPGWRYDGLISRGESESIDSRRISRSSSAGFIKEKYEKEEEEDDEVTGLKALDSNKTIAGEDGDTTLGDSSAIDELMISTSTIIPPSLNRASMSSIKISETTAPLNFKKVNDFNKVNDFPPEAAYASLSHNSGVALIESLPPSPAGSNFSSQFGSSVTSERSPIAGSSRQDSPITDGLRTRPIPRTKSLSHSSRNGQPTDSDSSSSSRAAAALASLDWNSVIKPPKSPNAARWREKSSVLSSSPSMPNLSSHWGGKSAARSSVSESVPDLPSGLHGLGLRKEEENKVIKSPVMSIAKATRKTSVIDLASPPEVKGDTTKVSNPSSPIKISTVSTTTTNPPHKFPTSISTTWSNVPLPPGITESSYFGISPSSSFDERFPDLPLTKEEFVQEIPISKTTFTNSKSLEDGMSFPSVDSATDLDQLMRNINSLSEDLFGDEIDDWNLGEEEIEE